MSPIPETQARKSRKRELPTKSKMPVAIFFSVLWLFILASAAHADGVTYTYTDSSGTNIFGALPSAGLPAGNAGFFELINTNSP